MKIKQFKDTSKVDSETKKATIMRDGLYQYTGAEIGVEGEEDTIFNVYRPAEEVQKCYDRFMELETIPVTSDHPDEFLDLSSEQSFKDGYGKNPVLTVGDSYDTVDCEIVLKDQALKDYQNNIKEISCGWDGYFEEAEEGQDYSFIQRFKDINHIAVLPEGRCGNVCSIKDKRSLAMVKKKIKDAEPDKKADKTKDQEGVQIEMNPEKMLEFMKAACEAQGLSMDEEKMKEYIASQVQAEPTSQAAPTDADPDADPDKPKDTYMNGDDPDKDKPKTDAEPGSFSLTKEQLVQLVQEANAATGYSTGLGNSNEILEKWLAAIGMTETTPAAPATTPAPEATDADKDDKDDEEEKKKMSDSYAKIVKDKAMFDKVINDAYNKGKAKGFADASVRAVKRFADVMPVIANGSVKLADCQGKTACQIKAKFVEDTINEKYDVKNVDVLDAAFKVALKYQDKFKMQSQPVADTIEQKIDAVQDSVLKIKKGE